MGRDFVAKGCMGTATHQIVNGIAHGADSFNRREEKSAGREVLPALGYMREVVRLL